MVKDDRIPEAIEIYQAGLAIKSDWATLYNNLGQVLLDKSPDRAIAAYQRAIELEPDFVLAHYNLGKAWQIQGEHSAAVACFDRVVELNPDHISGYTDGGFSLIALGKIAEALPYLAKAIAVKPDFVEAYCRLVEQRQVAQADDEFSMAIAAWKGSGYKEGPSTSLRVQRRAQYKCPILDAQCPIPDARCPMPNARCPITNW